jgi:hypothetical protein
MDTNPLDILAKTLPSGTRRRVVHVLAGLPLAAVATSLAGSSQASHAANAKGGTPCRRRRDRHRPPHRKQPNASCPECICPPGPDPTGTCPPDPRLTAIETCRANHGVAVDGTCDCAWLDSARSPADYLCPHACLCWLTVEGTGHCGVYSPPLPDRGTQACFSSTQCPPLTLGAQVYDQACVVWPDGGGPYCWPACDPRPS